MGLIILADHSQGVKQRAGRVGKLDQLSRISDTADAKKELLRLLAKNTVEQSLLIVGRSMSTYNNWRRDDESFRAEADWVIARKRGGAERRPVPDFESFARDFLLEPLYWHQQQWVDALEGRTPRELHPAQVWEPGDPDYLLINTPPNHAKSTTITMNYVTWRIVKDPNVRVIIVSKSQGMARDFLYGIKQRLTGVRYRDMQRQFGPSEGWEATAEQWAADQIILGEKDDGQKDPTVQVLGIGGQIYGARADLIICDDVVVLGNVSQADSQLRWISQEVQTRLNANGTMLVVGTRVGSDDLYKLIRKTFEGEWSYLTQPAILEQTGDPKTWVTLWPRSTMACGCKAICLKNGTTEPDENGEYPRWDGEHLSKLRGRTTPVVWSQAYMQMDVSEDSIFPSDDVLRALNKQRTHGIMHPGQVGHRKEGMDGLYVMCTMDPALTGACASLVVGIDVLTGKRWVLDIHNQMGMSPKSIHNHIRAWTDKYAPREWRIEKNAMQGMLTQDEELRTYLSSRGCRLVEHFTSGHNKWDGDFGVASMAPLFTNSKPLIDIPGNRVIGGDQMRAVDELVAQLVAWQPRPDGASARKAKPGTTDLVMALWFADIRAKELIGGRRAEGSFLPNRYLSPRGKARQRVVNIEDAIALQAATRAAV